LYGGAPAGSIQVGHTIHIYSLPLCVEEKVNAFLKGHLNEKSCEISGIALDCTGSLGVNYGSSTYFNHLKSPKEKLRYRNSRYGIKKDSLDLEDLATSRLQIFIPHAVPVVRCVQ
jgi:hypothetical protein